MSRLHRSYGTKAMHYDEYIIYPLSDVLLDAHNSECAYVDLSCCPI